MYLVDTNIWLERLLDQEQSDTVGKFLARVNTEALVISDFALHSIGIALTRLKAEQAFLRFIQDVVIDGAVKVVSLSPEEMPQLVAAMSAYQLDFDDAYHYVLSARLNATIVSLDGDYDRTDRGRKRPGQLFVPNPEG